MTTPHDAEGEARQALDALYWRGSEKSKTAILLDAYRAAVYARAMRDAVGVVDSMPSYDLDTGTGYGCHCAMKRNTSSWPGDWLDREALRDELTNLAALPATPSREGTHG